MGKRERAARKSHKREMILAEGNVTMHADHVFFKKYHPEAEPLKLGREHLSRWTVRRYAVVDAETYSESAPWSPLVGLSDVSTAA